MADERTKKSRKKKSSLGPTIGGIIVGFEQQIFRSTPPVNEVVAKAAPLAPVAAAGGGTMRVGLPGDPPADAATAPGPLSLEAPGVRVLVDLATGGRIASLRIDGHELLRTDGDGPIQWGSFPMAPYAGRVRDARLSFEGRDYALPVTLPPHAIHGTVLDRPWRLEADGSIATDLGPDWPFRGRAVQRFELSPDALTCRLEIEATERMPASIGWHPWFVRRPDGVTGELELELDAGAMLVRDAAGIATDQRVSPPPGPWDDCFVDLRRSPILRWPGFLELMVESDCPAWVIYTAPEDALCVEPQTAPPDALNREAAVVEPGRPLVATMTWRWRRLGG